MVLHEARHRQPGNVCLALRAEEFELVAGDFGLQRTVVALTPAGDQLVEADRVHDHAGQNVSADLAALLDHDDFNVFASFLCELFCPDRRGQTRRATANDDQVIFHRLALYSVISHWFLLLAGDRVPAHKPI